MNRMRLSLCMATLWIWSGGASLALASDPLFERFESQVQPIFVQYCSDCHSSPEPKGGLDLSAIQSAENVEDAYHALRSAVKAVQAGIMPPQDHPQPTLPERQALQSWFDERFIQIEPQAAPLRARRLSAHEYRQTLRSLLGFELEVNVTLAEETISQKSMVMKLLPTDPPGVSGYRNDTHRNPISPIAWQRYSELADLAIAELFSSARQAELARLTGGKENDIDLQAARQLLRHWLARVYRRPVSDQELGQAFQRIDQAEDPRQAVQFELKASLMSPRFLYRGLLATAPAAGQQPVDDYELAERLSYFLWADMPDEELMQLAASGSLQQEAILIQQVDRMLAARQADNLANDLVTQWLLLDEINQVSDTVPQMIAMQTQVTDLIKYMIAEDRPLTELIDCRYEFVNMYTARFYGEDARQLQPHNIPPGIEVPTLPNQRIELVSSRDRGGLLTMPGILAMNRGAIIRGTWMLERILGEPLPDPPANVGEVKPNQPGQELTFRQRFEQHRAQTSCAVCHDKIDPLGFVLESYAADGGLISQGQVDTSGKLPTGETFANVAELKQILTGTQRRAVLRNIIQQFLAYALCRQIEYYDLPTVEAIVARLDDSASPGSFRQLIHQIVLSLPFRQACFAGARP